MGPFTARSRGDHVEHDASGGGAGHLGGAFLGLLRHVYCETSRERKVRVCGVKVSVRRMWFGACAPAWLPLPARLSRLSAKKPLACVQDEQIVVCAGIYYDCMARGGRARERDGRERLRSGDETR